VDSYSGQSYEHRRGWVEERLLYLSSVYAIDICAYAVMSNHVKVVVHVDADKAGYIEHQHSPILSRLGLDAEQWLCLTTEFEKHFCYAAGAEQMMNSFKRHTNHQRMRGMGKAKLLLSTG
jgi:hypothetical protein